MDFYFFKTSKGIDTNVIHYVRHSPTGMNSGYGGSGPADLAYSILVCHFRFNKGFDIDMAQEWATQWYQSFKWQFISPVENVYVTQSQIEEFLNENPPKAN